MSRIKFVLQSRDAEHKDWTFAKSSDFISDCTAEGFDRLEKAELPENDKTLFLQIVSFMEGKYSDKVLWGASRKKGDAPDNIVVYPKTKRA